MRAYVYNEHGRIILCYKVDSGRPPREIHWIAPDIQPAVFHDYDQACDDSMVELVETAQLMWVDFLRAVAFYRQKERP